MKKIIFILAFIFVSVCSVNAAVKSTVAEIILGSTAPVCENASVANSNGYKIETVDGKACWVLGTTADEKRSILVDFNGAVSSSGIDNYILDITYYDYGRGRFFVSYYNHTLGSVESKPILCEGTNEWKTVSVEIFGMKTDNRLEVAGDLKVYNYSADWSFSPDNVYIEKLNLYKTGMDDTAKIVFPNEGIATNLFKGKSQQVTYTMTNIGPARRTFTPKYTVEDEEGNVLWTGNGENITVSKKGSKSVTVDLDIQKYGVHNFIVEITDNGGGYSKNSIEIGVIRYEDKPVKNPDLGISAHFSWNAELLSTMELYDQMGAGFLRDEVLWKDYSANNNSIPEKHMNYINAAVEVGVEPLMILGYGHPDYDNGNLPVSDEGLKAFGEYVYNLVSDLKGKVTYFEVWNEHNCTAMGDSEKSMKTAGAEYAKLLKIAYTEAKKANPDCKIVGLVSAGWSYDFGVGMKEYDANIENYMDIMSFHEYGKERKPESSEYINALNYCVNNIKKSFGDKEIWLTEFGWADNVYGITETEAAMWDIRFNMYNTDKKIVDKLFRYTWNDNGYAPGKYEYTLGVLNYNYAVKKLYIAYQNMNYMLSGATLSGHTVDENKNHIYKYSLNDEVKISVVFNENDTENQVSLTPEYGKIFIFDMYGNEISKTKSDGKYIIKTNGEPVYFVEESIEEIAAKYDFNNVEDGTLPDGLIKYSGGAASGCYQTIDKAYGNSMLLKGTSGFTYNFGDIITDTKTVTFDVKKTGNASGQQLMIFAGAGNLSYSKEILMELTATNAKFGYANASPTNVPFAQDEWYTVDMQITGSENSSTVVYYLDGKYVATYEDRPLMSNITFFGHWNSALNPYIDNLTIRNIEYVSPKTKISGSFNFDSGKNGNGNFHAVLPAGWEQANSGDTWWNNYKKIDNEHGLSLGTKGRSGFCYPLENAISKEGILSFELYTDNITDTKGFYIEGQKGSLWDNNMLIRLAGAELRFGGIDTRYAIEANTWYKIDLKFLYDNSHVVQYYVNGEYIGEANRDAINAIFCMADGRDAAFTYIDNVKLNVPYTTTRINITADLQIPELNKNTIILDFDTTVNRASWNEAGVTVEKADGTSVEVERSELNEASTGAVVYLTEDLDYNTQYKVAFPDGTVNVFGDKCLINELTFTTANKINCFENFNDDTLIGGFSNVSVADGKAVIGEDAYGDFKYTLPYTVNSGVVKMSYDLTVTQKANTTGGWAIMNLYGTNSFGSNQMMQWNTTPYCDWSNLGYTWEAGRYYHYDFIFDLDNGTVTMYQDGVKKVLSGETVSAISSVMIFAETNKGVILDNFRFAYTATGAEFTCDAEDIITYDKKTFYVEFSDAADVTTFDYIQLTDENEYLYDIDISGLTSEGGEIVVLEDYQEFDGKYQLDLSNVKTTTGEKYSNGIIEFAVEEPVEVFEFKAISVKDGDAVVTLDTWEATKAYTLSADIINSKGAEKNVTVVVAGYSDTGLKNVQTVDLKITESDIYTKALEAVSMAGVTNVKIFVLDNLDTITPVLDAPFGL